MTRLAALAALLLTACATPPIPPDSCAADLTAHYGPRLTERHVNVACDYWTRQTGRPASLEGVSVFVGDFPTSRAIIGHYGTVIEVRHGPDWQRELHHEVWHVLLHRHDPFLDADDHHRRMLDLGLCKPVTLCGYRSFAPPPRGMDQ